jgi:hypothetical protein
MLLEEKLKSTHHILFDNIPRILEEDPNEPIGPRCFRPVRLAYQPPASSIFLSQQTSHQQRANITLLSEQTITSHQPTEQAVCLLQCPGPQRALSSVKTSSKCDRSCLGKFSSSQFSVNSLDGGLPKWPLKCSNKASSFSSCANLVPEGVCKE